ncbi:MAG: cytochrome P450 [Steroidobacteraceae bacterium]
MKAPADFDFVDPQLQSNPMEFFAALRAQAPVYLEPRTGAYFVTRAEDIRAAVGQPEVFSNQIDPNAFRVCQGLTLEERDPEVAQRLKAKAWLAPHTLLFTDPPIHGRYRRLVMEALSPQAVRKIEPLIKAQVDRYLMPFDSGAPVDFLAEFAQRLPLSIILNFLGASLEHMDKVNAWTDQLFSTMMVPTSREEYLKSVDAVAEMYHFVAGRIEEIRQQPDGSLLSTLMRAHEVTGDAPLTLEELLSICQVLLIAGHDSTRQSLTSAVCVLATHPELYERLSSNRELIKSFVEEVVRMFSPANVTPRFTLQDTTLGGVHIPKHSPVFICWGSGNRDEQVFAGTDEFRCPRENVTSHLGFGHGIHFCAGMRLARAELAHTIEAILDRYSEVSLAIDPEELTYAPAINLRALTTLPIRCRLRTQQRSNGAANAREASVS